MASSPQEQLQRIYGTSAEQRSLGLWYGLCAGDRNGGPQRMALRIGESLLTTTTTCRGTTATTATHTASSSSASDISQKPPLIVLDRDDIARRYMAWSFPHVQDCFIKSTQPRGSRGDGDDASSQQQQQYPSEPERAYDTGAVFYEVVHNTFKTLTATANAVSAHNNNDVDAAVVAALNEKLSAACEEDQHNNILSATFDLCALTNFKVRESAGVNPAHRNAVLATVNGDDAVAPGGREHDASSSSVDDEAEAKSDAHFAAMAKGETTLTHVHPECVDTSIATVIMCRALIRGETLEQSAVRAVKHLTNPLTVEVVEKYIARLQTATTAMAAPLTDGMATQHRPQQQQPRREQQCGLHLSHPRHRGGRSPLVLEAALYFVTMSTSFDEALTASIAFAGPDNYCPVLVGSIGGARFGISHSLMNQEVTTRVRQPSSSSSSSLTPAASSSTRGGEVGVTMEHLMHREFLTPQEHKERIRAVALQLSDSWTQKL